jgi:hypothetical protein
LDSLGNVDGSARHNHACYHRHYSTP